MDAREPRVPEVSRYQLCCTHTHTHSLTSTHGLVVALDATVVGCSRRSSRRMRATST